MIYISFVLDLLVISFSKTLLFLQLFAPHCFPVVDDLDVAVDFFQYFAATHHLLLEDDSLWCVSAWNDNGKSDKVKDPGLYLASLFIKAGNLKHLKAKVMCNTRRLIVFLTFSFEKKCFTEVTFSLAWAG